MFAHFSLNHRRLGLDKTVMVRVAYLIEGLGKNDGALTNLDDIVAGELPLSYSSHRKSLIMSSISVQISMWQARNDERTVRYQSRRRFLIDVGGRGIALAIPVSVCEAHVAP